MKDWHGDNGESRIYEVIGKNGFYIIQPKGMLRIPLSKLVVDDISPAVYKTLSDEETNQIDELRALLPKSYAEEEFVELYYYDGIKTTLRDSKVKEALLSW